VLESKPNTPDAVFPNNWFSTHLIDNQTYVFIYPMYTQNRRNEVKVDKLLEQINKLTTTNYKVIDFRGDYSKALEGTGVFIFAHEFKTDYMSVSPKA
ncbi:arginine deiminase-related protein, partial [Francisella tularensis]|uniref:arginine deiminase-related protein n=1 Tax=Francisella tularensis TaxID=263 RepID=UPI0023819AF5